MHSDPKRLYDYPFSGNGYKIRLALRQLCIAFEYRVVDILQGETRTPAFLALNPMGQIPVLELEDGTALRESNAILFWLTEATPLMPPDRLGRAQVVQWMNFEQGNIDKVLGRTRFLKRYPHVMETRQSDWDGWRATGDKALGVLDSALCATSFLVGEAYSAADICLYGYVHTAADGGFDLAPFPAVEAWLERVRAQPRHISIDEFQTPRQRVEPPEVAGP